ncbi:peptide deformylase [Pedobacter caeni]|uniref:Peptide deformylase n=1 Tax=Pedobacter caeni TaxID=288992 RepID=A0A1M4WME1_9SPHI|nr:peptide deformylase [Pedobacter caeni]SHE82320.1 peptide deformylase [Pedobacter caeni]
MKTFLIALLGLLVFNPDAGFAQGFTAKEKSIILSGDTATMLRVTQITEAPELKVLTTASADIDPKDPLIKVLAQRMYLAMRDVTRPGIGIAGPQVGINRNIIWVKRYDKEGEPFELYLNPKISWRSELLRKGREGCLSIPDVIGDVVRHHAIKLKYDDQSGSSKEEIIEGFTAVIFQHETDHLNGILFTERLKEQERKVYNSLAGRLDFMVEKFYARP